MDAFETITQRREALADMLGRLPVAQVVPEPVDLTEAVRFAKGEVLPAGGLLLIVGDVADAGAGPQSECLPEGPMKCYQASWKISASMGESVYIVSKSDEVLDKADYPPNAVLDGQTWGRYPDGTGDFVANLPTPGKANQTP